MRTLLGYDGLLAQLCRGICRIFLLSCLFAFCCLPIFTVGAAAAALYAAFLNEHQQGGTFGNFFRDFAANFRKGTVLWLIMLAIGLILAGDWYALSVREFPLHTVLQILTVLATAVYAITLALVFPLQAHFENSVGQTLKNALVLGLGMPVRALLMMAITCLPLVLFLWDLDSFIQVAALWVVFGAGIVGWVNSTMMKKAFARLAPKPEEAARILEQQ